MTTETVFTAAEALKLAQSSHEAGEKNLQDKIHLHGKILKPHAERLIVLVMRDILRAAESSNEHKLVRSCVSLLDCDCVREENETHLHLSPGEVSDLIAGMISAMLEERGYITIVFPAKYRIIYKIEIGVSW